MVIICDHLPQKTPQPTPLPELLFYLWDNKSKMIHFYFMVWQLESGMG
ncbi:MAG: hypothetical protein IPN79_18550 [Saprospiraceae bacterium]|nr:hypothetical protein [Saprospiraceae bacterium]